MTLPELVQSLAAMKLEQRELESRAVMIEKEIFRQAVDELAIVKAPRRGNSTQFRCAGKIVELQVGAFGHRDVQLFEVDSLPSA